MQKLYTVCGIPFSGKSVLSKDLAKKMKLIRIDLDEIKSDHVGNISDKDVSQEQWDVVYQDMYVKLKKALLSGQSVIQDAGNFTKYERGLVRDIAMRLGIPTIVIYVDIPLSLAQERRKRNEETKERFSVTEEVLVLASKEMEPPSTDEMHVIYKGELVDRWIKETILH